MGNKCSKELSKTSDSLLKQQGKSDLRGKRRLWKMFHLALGHTSKRCRKEAIYNLCLVVFEPHNLSVSLSIPSP